jgi:hypothetical protein
MSSVLRVISNGAEHSSDEDVRNALWYIEGSIEDIHDSLYVRFNELWEVVRDEDFDELAEKVKNKHKGGMKKKKQMTDKELP